MFERVLIAGVGAIGSEIAKNLGLLGCKNVFIADADVVEPQNIGRSVLLCRAPKIGQSKIVQALDQLKTGFPHTDWNGDSIEIADVDADHFLGADILFSCVDSDLARTEIAALAARYGSPVCDGGLGGTSTRIGRVSWFPGTRQAACFACLLSPRRRARLLHFWESDVQACWAGDADDPSDKWTSTPTMASIVAGLQVELALSASKTGGAFSVHIDLDRISVSERINHPRSSGCPFHDDIAPDVFPICTLAECIPCGGTFSPHRRIGWVRRWGTCPSCGSRRLKICESLRGEPAGRL